MIIAGSLVELLLNVEKRMSGKEMKCLRVNVGKMKTLLTGTNLERLKKPGKDSWTICQTEIGRNAIFCHRLL